jgi:hypothetical protein
VTQISSEATSGFAAGEANDGDDSVRIGKTKKGASVDTNTFQVSGSLTATRGVAILCKEYVIFIMSDF